MIGLKEVIYIMSKHFILLSSLVLVASFLTTCILAAPNDTLKVQKAVTGFSDAWNHHDMDAFGRLFTVDAYFANVAGQPLKGRQEIQMHHAWSHGTVPIDTKVPGTAK
jgi:SnoaL-like domain